MILVPHAYSNECREARSIEEMDTALRSKRQEGWNQSAFTLVPGGVNTSFRSLKDPPGVGPPLMT